MAFTVAKNPGFLDEMNIPARQGSAYSHLSFTHRANNEKRLGHVTANSLLQSLATKNDKKKRGRWKGKMGVSDADA